MISITHCTVETPKADALTLHRALGHSKVASRISLKFNINDPALKPRQAQMFAFQIQHQDHRYRKLHEPKGA